MVLALVDVNKEDVISSHSELLKVNIVPEARVSRFDAGIFLKAFLESF